MISKCQYSKCKNKTMEYRIVNISKFLQSKINKWNQEFLDIEKIICL